MQSTMRVIRHLGVSKRRQLRSKGLWKRLVGDVASDLEKLFDPQWYGLKYPATKWRVGSAFRHFMSAGVYRSLDPHPLFDGDWYRQKYLGGQFGVPPILDYLKDGWKLERQPNPYFDGILYGVNHGAFSNPLVHCVEEGAESSFPAASLFNAAWYVKQAPEAAHFPGGPFAHFCRVGVQKGLSPIILFDSEWYRAVNTDVRDAGYPAFQHYKNYGYQERRSPHPLFDARFYVDTNADVNASGMDPLQHFVSTGHLEGRKPNALFDTAWYRKTYLEADTQVNALEHYLEIGASSGCNPNPFFDNDWYLSQHETLKKDNQNALVHYVMHGVQEGRDPSPYFDTDAYLARNRVVAEKGSNPLVHFIANGGTSDGLMAPDGSGVFRCPVMHVPYQIWRTPPLAAADDTCVFVTFTSDGHLASHVSHYLNALHQNGLKIVLVVVTNGIIHRIDYPGYIVGLLVRRNHGWDFAAWAAALTVFPALWQCRSLILANDSVFGPVNKDNFEAVLAEVRSSQSEVLALTDSMQVQYHVMSFFIAITKKGLASESLRRFWHNIESFRDKQEVINRYEINGIASWENGSVRYDALFPCSEYGICNPTLDKWQQLVDRGFPFVKVQLLRDGFVKHNESWEDVFVKEPALLRCVTNHLRRGAQQGKDNTQYRPLPPPWRRFKRDPTLLTFYGSVRAVRPTDQTDFALEVPFSEHGDHNTSRVAVVMHIYYEDLASELLSYLSNIPGKVDLFVSTNSDAKKAAIEDALVGHRSGTVEVRVFPNIGRDIAPMLLGFKDVIHRYEFLLHIHTKKSPHGSEFSGWREFLLQNLLGSAEIVSSILDLLKIEDIGIVYSQHFAPVRPVLNWGGNFNTAKTLLARIGVKLRKDMLLEFPSSSFFWVKTKALRQLTDIQMDWSDFAAEEGQVDGTLAHAIERCLLYFVEAAGFRWSKVAVLKNADPASLVNTVSNEALERSIEVVHRPLLYNHMPSMQTKKVADEIIGFCLGRDRSDKPRLNLVIPSLHKDHFFGGTSTAIRLFKEIAKSLPHFDQRIICTTVPLDLESMLRFPGWHLEVVGVQTDHSDKAIVDLTSGDRGTLSIRERDILIPTAWWTAELSINLRTTQTALFGLQTPLVYLIQDHESHFYPWDERYVIAENTYRASNTIAIVNSEELSNYLASRYRFESAYTLPYAANAEITRSVIDLPKERLIIFYGRPSVSRNAFRLVCAALSLWQQSNPRLAGDWSIVSLGELYPPQQAGPLKNLQVRGKLDLAEYGQILSVASVGISMMVSPHPSYPPLEMAAAGLETITNAFEQKDLSRRSSQITSLVDLTAENIAEALQQAVYRAEKEIGKIKAREDIKTITSCYPPLEMQDLANVLSKT